MSEHDLVIRGGTVIDGSGSDRRTADVAVSNGVVTEVGQVSGTGHREVAADGKLVQPGFVDIHTHYDGQATWDSQLAPSSWHGVTTIVMGNCGVGFAPVRPSDHERLIRLMEGVEDIPGTALHEGLPWAWESFEEYLDFLDGRSYDIDLGAQLPHAAVRVNVMGDRGVAREPATPDDIAQMAEIARRAAEAGAIGFTSSRSLNHRASTGEYTPTLQAERDEMIGIAEALGAAGKGVIQIISDLVDFDQEFALAKAMGARSGRPVSMSVAQAKGRPDQWRRTLDAMSQATAEGVVMRGQVGARAVGLLMGHQGTLNPFMHCEAYKAIAHLPLAERVEALRRDEVRSAILDNVIVDKESPIIGSRLVTKWHIMYPLGDPPDYEPDASTSLAAIAERTGADPAVLAYDLLLERDGTAMIYVPTVNYVDGNLDSVREQILHDAAVPGLSDGGAHVGTICDVSFPTTLMQWWGRDRPHGRIPLETIVAKQARATAETVGFMDRGLLTPGYKADINVIDFDALTLHAPTIVGDLPAGGNRLMQKVTGIDHTFVSGIEVASNSESTGATPGRLVRGAQKAGQ
ncbi:MAG: amidohydrolase family protein [Acidimicrobiaceae bacterium]|nr:amidohydrolase family protein [Acidimicrobiaceae bacterium]